MIKEAAIFALVVIFVSDETACWPHDRNKRGLEYSLLHKNHHLASETNSSRTDNVTSRFKRHIPFDKCCVKRKIYTDGRVTFECRSEHPDCFPKRSSSFGQCESIVNSKNIVIACRCAA
ncbi:uncharacterized protein LOC144649544 [Oculina patagonica]